MSECQIFEDERKRSKLNKQMLGEYIYGQKNLKSFMDVQKRISDDEILRNNPAHYGLSRQDLYDVYMLKTKRLNELFDITEFEFMQNGASIFAEQIGCSLHVGMFMTTLDLLCDDNQRKRFIEQSKKMEIIGCYAQTELGHGSDVQNLELQAIFDKNTQEFIMHSPTISSTKWWIGDLGKNANHVVTHAQIIVDGKRKALGTFIIQIRCMKSHLALEGVEVGDIGPKYGYNTKDNGYLRFNNFRIPKENLLGKYMQISNEGKIIRVGNEKLSYGTMMKIRTLILNVSYRYIGQGLIICTRYSMIRKQFKGENKQERAVIEYQSQMNKIIPLVAFGYAMSQCSQSVEEIIDENQLRMQKEDYSMLNAIHCLISGFKSLFTSTTLEGLEQLRNACGGHGYMQYSGFPSIIQEYSPTATYEGENTVLYLQTARYLMKMYNKANKDKPVDQFTSYFKQYKGLLQTQLETDQNEALGSVENLEKMLAFSAIMRIEQASKKLMSAVVSKMDLKTAWDQKAGISLVECAKAHAIFTCFSMFKQKIEKKGGIMKEQMIRLLQLFAVEKVLERPQALFMGGYLNSEQFKFMRTNIKENLLLQIRPDLLTLVEGFNMDDNSLKSAIGMSNGKPYQNLMDWVTTHNPINQPKVTANLIKHWISTPIPTPKL